MSDMTQYEPTCICGEETKPPIKISDMLEWRDAAIAEARDKALKDAAKVCEKNCEKPPCLSWSQITFSNSPPRVRRR